MSRDLLDFSIALGQGLNRAVQIYEKNQDRDLAAQRYNATLGVAMARNRIQDARYQEWAKTQNDYRDLLKANAAAKRAKTAGAGTGAAPTTSPALQNAIANASTQGYVPPVTPQAPNVTVEAPDVMPPPPGMPPDVDTAPAIPAGPDGYRRGGPVKKFAKGGKVTTTPGTSGPGSGFGDRAAPAAGYVPGMRNGGVVRFEGGGDTRRWWEAAGGPDEHSANKRVDVGAERDKDKEPSPVMDKIRKNVGELKDFWDYMGPGPLGKAISRSFNSPGDTTVEPPPVAGQGVPPPEGWDRQGAIDTTPRGPSGAAASTEPAAVPAGRSGAAASTEPDAVPAPAPQPGTRRVAGGGGTRSGQRGGLRDQSRTAAFDPVADAGDPDNQQGLSTQAYQGQATAPPQGGSPASGMTGGPGEGNVLSTNDANHDAALQGGNTFAGFLFHQNKPDYHTQEGKHALLAGHGAATPPEVDAVIKALKLPDDMPMDQKIQTAMTAAHRYYVQQGKPEIADKVAFELMQFSNVMAKQHGASAVQSLQKGDLANATHQLLAGYNWLPNGGKANVDPSGQNIVISNQEGKVIQSYPINAQTIKNFALGMASGELNWDVLRGHSDAPPAQGGPQQGTPAPQGQPALPPQVTAQAQPPAAIQTQPPSPAAGPAASPAPASPAPPPQTGGTPSPEPAPQGSPPPQAVSTNPAAAAPAQQPPANPYEVPPGVYRRFTKPTDYSELKQYEDPSFQSDMAGYMKGLASTQGGKGGQREAATWNHLMSWRASKHAEMMKARQVRENELNRQSDNDLKEERAGLKTRRERSQEEESVNTGIKNRLAEYAAGSKTMDPETIKHMNDRAALTWMDTDNKKENLVQAANNIYKSNGTLSSKQATDIALRMTDTGDDPNNPSTSFKPIGLDADSNVVVQVVHGGRNHLVHMPKETYSDIVQLHKDTMKAIAKAKTAKINKAKEDARQSAGALDTAARATPDMTPSLNLPM